MNRRDSSIQIDDAMHPGLAWSYDFPTRQLLPMANPVAFSNDKVNVFPDRPATRPPDYAFFTSSD